MYTFHQTYFYFWFEPFVTNLVHLSTSIKDKYSSYNVKDTFLVLVICSGSILLGVIIALILNCIGYFKNKVQHYDSESSQGSDRSGSVELPVLAECLATCGYTTEEIVRIQQIMSEA